MLDAVKAALEPKEQETSPPSEPEDSKAGSTEKPEEKPEEGLSDEDRKNLKPKVAKRIDSLLNDRKTLRAENDGLKQKAANLDEMLGFFQRSNLSPEDVKTGHTIMALMKSSPAKAYEMLQPIVSQLASIVGEGPLPQDLAEKVRLGYINEADARALAKANSRLQLNESAEQNRAAREAAEEAERGRQALVTDVASAASAWERDTAKNDPDWHLKSARVHELMKLSVYEKGYPTSDADVRARLKDAHEQVGKELRRLNPRPKAINPVTGQSSPPRSAAEPKTMLEAIQAGLRGAA